MLFNSRRLKVPDDYPDSCRICAAWESRQPDVTLDPVEASAKCWTGAAVNVREVSDAIAVLVSSLESEAKCFVDL